MFAVRRLVVVLALVVLALVVVACGRPAATGTIVVSTASSLTDVFAAVGDAFEAANPGSDVQLNLGSSTALASQIITGAPVDVFASADSDNAERVGQADLIESSARFATNHLVVAFRTGNPNGVTGIEDLARPDLIVGLCSDAVPCGELARSALREAGIVAAIDTEEPNARALVTKIELGEIDVGLVYQTDVRNSAELEGVPITDAPRAAYWISALVDGPNPTGAEAFVEFVVSAEGRSILAEYGFGSP